MCLSSHPALKARLAASSKRDGDELELELELILSQMAQKPMLRGEVGARALRVRSDVRGMGVGRESFYNSRGSVG